MATQIIELEQTTIQTQPTRQAITGVELFAMGDIGPAELVKGEIVKHRPTGHPHGFIELNIGSILRSFVKRHKLGRVLCGEVGIYTQRSPDTVRGADVAFISQQRLTQAQPQGYLDIAPELVVEVLSPDDRWPKVREKLAEYFGVGVQLLWVVDPQRQSLHVYRALTDYEMLTIGDTLRGGAVLPDFEVSVEEVFEE